MPIPFKNEAGYQLQMRVFKIWTYAKELGHEPRIKLAYGRSCQPAHICTKCGIRISSDMEKCKA